MAQTIRRAAREGRLRGGGLEKAVQGLACVEQHMAQAGDVGWQLSQEGVGQVQQGHGSFLLLLLRWQG
jgi:hypothetical protein